jgi:putative transposase
MRTLNLRKVRWIVREMEKRELSAYQIAKQQGITPRHVRRIYKRYRGLERHKLNEVVSLKRCGRKPKQSTDYEINAVLDVNKELGFGATNIEKVLSQRGIHIPHNRIHRILLENNLANIEPKKSRRRKWIRWERKHSNSLWHTDWSDYKGTNLILYEDDASRLIVGFGIFRNATTDNAIDVLNSALSTWGTPKQLMSDHGAQFCADEKDVYRFTEYLKSNGIQHILARVKHPQSNGKIERLFYTIKHLLDEGESLEAAVKFYNEERPHMSLENGHLRTPLTAFNEKKRNN